MLATIAVMSCTACSGLDALSDNLKGGVKQLGDDAAVTGFNGQDILVANTDLKETECREITVHYNFKVSSGSCRLIYISPNLEETELTENGNDSVTVQLQAGANYIGIYGMDYSGTIQITIE